MGRLIVNNKTDLPMLEVMRYVSNVMENGRVSDDGRMYAYVTTYYRQDGKRLVVFASRSTETSDSFQVTLE